MNQHEKYYTARDLAWEAKIQDLKTPIAKRFEDQDRLAYNKEYACLPLDFGRQTGSTYWMIHKAAKLLGAGNSCMLAFPKEDIRHRTMHLAKESGFSNDYDPKFSKINTCTMADAVSTLWKCNPDFLFVDVSSMFNVSTINQFYKDFKGKIIALL